MSAVFEFTLLVPLLPQRHAVQLLVGTCARAPREANSDPPPLLVTEIPLGLDRGGRLGFLRGGGPAFGLQQRIDQAGTPSERLAQLSPPAIAGADDLAEGHGLARQLLADGAAEEAIVIEEADLRHVARVVAQHDLLARIRGERQIAVAQPQESNAALMDATSLGHGEHEQIELFERLRHLREEPAGIPAGLRRLARFPVRRG